LHSAEEDDDDFLDKAGIKRRLTQDIVWTVLEENFGGIDENKKVFKSKEEKNDSRFLFIMEKFLRHWKYQKAASRKLL
jgi:hypothetical protein